MITVSSIRSRVGAMVVVAAAVGALALVSAAPANAAEAGAWGTFTVAGSSKAYTGTMSLPGGFPETTFTSTSSAATTPSGVSTWQANVTPVGEVYGTSRGKPYLNQRPNANNAASPAITTYTFASPTPASGWSFVVGDIDADGATIAGTDVNGDAVPVDALGFQGAYNYCDRAGGPSCDTSKAHDLPTWDPATATLTGNATATDTEGASGWFSPSVPLETLTITYQWRSGFPVYQTWFATKTFAASGAVRVNGAAYGGAKLTIRDASGTAVATTTTAGDGTWSVPGLVSTSGYTVSVATPPEAAAADPITFDTLDADTPGLDFDFTIPPVEVTATIVTPTGEPAADTPIVITRDGDDAPTATTTTDADGGFTAELLPGQPYTIVVDGADDQPIEFTTPTTSGALATPLAQPAAPAPPAPPAPPVSGSPAPSPTPVIAGAADDPAELAMTGTAPELPFAAGGLLLAAGVALMVAARVRTRRRP